MSGVVYNPVQPLSVFSTAFNTTYRRHSTKNNSLNKKIFLSGVVRFPGQFFYVYLTAASARKAASWKVDLGIPQALAASRSVICIALHAW